MGGPQNTCPRHVGSSHDPWSVGRSCSFFSFLNIPGGIGPEAGGYSVGPWWLLGDSSDTDTIRADHRSYTSRAEPSWTSRQLEASRVMISLISLRDSRRGNSRQRLGSRSEPSHRCRATTRPPSPAPPNLQHPANAGKSEGGRPQNTSIWYVSGYTIRSILLVGCLQSGTRPTAQTRIRVRGVGWLFMESTQNAPTKKICIYKHAITFLNI